MKIIQSLLVGISAFLFFYLLGSFYNADFNIKNWSDFSRYTISFLGGISASILFGIHLFKDKI